MNRRLISLLHVGGLRWTVDGIRTVQWVERRLKVGDEVTIRVADVDEADISPPTRERPIAEVTESGERKQLAYLIREVRCSMKSRSGTRHNKALQRAAFGRR